jgi:hypothetical protein
MPRSFNLERMVGYEPTDGVRILTGYIKSCFGKVKQFIRANNTKENWKTFVILMLCQFTGYFLVTINFRSISQANILVSESTDAINASLGYFVIKKIAKDDSHIMGWLGYLTGSLLGTYVGIKYSLIILGK